MTASTDQAPGEVPRAGGRHRAMLALGLLLSLAWLYYLLVADVQLRLRLDMALATVPPAFARVLKLITLSVAFLLPALLLLLLLSRVGAALDAPGPSPELMLEAVREGHRKALAQSRELMETELAKLSDVEAAELRPHLEEGLRRAQESAALREQRYAADPALMQQDLRATIAEIRTKQDPA
jgi:hypothetical protein